MPSILDDEWKLKRLKKSHNYESYGRSKSPIHYKNKSKSHLGKRVKNSNRVVIKIYSSCKNRIGMSRHIDYITVKSDISMTSDGLILTDSSDIYCAKDRMLAENPDLDSGKNKRETFNFSFSLRDYDLHNISKEEYQKLMNECVIETVKEKYPDNFFVSALHSDTDNPHIHICLGKMDIERQKKIDLRKYDLKVLKYIFSEKLIEKGFKVMREPEPYKKHIVDQFKTNDFEFIKAGEANYEFNAQSSMSFYVQYRTNRDQGIVTLWGKGLREAVIQSGVKEGDRVRIKREMQEQGKAANWSINVLEKVKMPAPDKLKTLFSDEEKAIFNKDQGEPDVTGQGVDKQSKALETLFTSEEKAEFLSKEPATTSKQPLKALEELFTKEEKEALEEQRHSKEGQEDIEID